MFPSNNILFIILCTLLFIFLMFNFFNQDTFKSNIHISPKSKKHVVIDNSSRKPLRRTKV